MRKILSLMAIAIALACGACAKSPEEIIADAKKAFPASLDFKQPEGVK